LQGGGPLPSSTNRFRCFDGLRASAAIAVFAFHYLGASNPAWLHGGARRWVWQLGPQGIAVFFVISGFLLYRPFVVRALNGQTFPPIREFMGRRFLRIFPAYWVALAGLMILGLGRIHSSQDFFIAVALVQNYRRGSELSGLGIAWTLVIEVSFYLALPVIALALRGLGGTGSNASRRLEGQIVGLMALEVVGVASRVWFLWLHPIHPVPIGTWFSVFALPMSIFWYLDYFVLGLLLAVASAQLQVTGRTWRPFADLSRRPWLCWLLAFGAFAIVCNLALGGVGNPRGTRFAYCVSIPLRGIVALLFVLPAVFGAEAKTTIRQLLSSRIMRSLGIISFGIYLWHLTMLQLLDRWIKSGAIHDNLITRLAFAVGSTLVLASASYFVIERPLMRFSHRRRVTGEPTSTGPPHQVVDDGDIAAASAAPRLPQAG
jgi:peptidoglycan/LPS O-acetylase OafA/YrhL